MAHPNIFIPTKKLLLDEFAPSEVCGFYQLQTFKTNIHGQEIIGSRRACTPVFPNLITDLGLDQMGQAVAYLTSCQVGSGTSTPLVTDIGLQSRIAGTSDPITSSAGSQPSAPYYGWRRNTYRFEEGVAAGNLSEVGIGPSPTASSLFSRARILDSEGNPTTVTVLSDESLDVIYEFRKYPNLTDVTGTMVFTGNIGGTYDYIIRAASVTTEFQPASTGTSESHPRVAQSVTGDIAAITGTPGGTASTMSISTSGSYVNGNRYANFLLSCSLTQGNLSGGIRCIIVYAGIGVQQMQFTPKIPKTSSDVLSMTFRQAWARKTL